MYDSTVLFESPNKGGANEYLWLGRGASARFGGGVVARPLHGESLTVGILDFEPLTHVPEHRHDNEQLGLVVKGSITVVIDGQRRELRVGEMYSIRGGIPHSGESGPDGATVIDVFSPARSDWNDTPRLPSLRGAGRNAGANAH